MEREKKDFLSWPPVLSLSLTSSFLPPSAHFCQQRIHFLYFLDVDSISAVCGRQQCHKGKWGSKVWCSPLLTVCPISTKDPSPLIYYCLLALFHHPWSFCHSSEPCKVSLHPLSHFLQHPPFFRMLRRRAINSVCQMFVYKPVTSAITEHNLHHTPKLVSNGNTWCLVSYGKDSQRCNRIWRNGEEMYWVGTQHN